jgi:PAS domain S-box-containing protein
MSSDVTRDVRQGPHMHDETSMDALAAELDEARRRIAALEAEAGLGTLYRDVVDTMREGFALVDADGVHIDVNPAFCRMTGFSRDELIGSGLPHVYWPPEEREVLLADYRRIRERGSYTEATLMRKNGERFPVLIGGTPIPGRPGSRPLAFGTFRDLSELHRATTAFEASEANFRSLVEHLDDVVVRYDTQLRFTYVSPAIGSLAPRSPQEMIGKTNAEAGFPPELATLFDDVLARTTDSRRPLSAEFPIRGFPGERVGEARVYPELDRDGHLVSLLAIARDVTARSRAEQEAASTNRLLRLAADIAASFIDMPLAITDDGITDALGRVARFLGADRAHVFQLDDGGTTASVTHEWSGPGIPPWHDAVRLPVATFSWWQTRMVSDKILSFATVAELPDEAGPERQFLTAHDVESYIVISLRRRGIPFGFVGLSARREKKWPPQSGLLVRLLRETLAGALERQRAGAALARSEADHRALFDSVGDMIFVTDADERILHANPAAISGLGFALDELVGLHMLDLHPEHLRAAAEETHARIRAGELRVCPLPFRRADGSTVPAETRVSLGRWRGVRCFFRVARNLTAEQEAQRRFDQLFHATPTPIAVNDPVTLRFIEVNDTFVNALGYTRDEIVGATPDDLGIFPHPGEVARALEELFETGRMDQVEIAVQTKDGRLLEGAFVAEFIESQGARFLLTVMLDITARKRAEVKLRELNATLEERVTDRTIQLENANRELEGFVHSVAHDLRGPLRAVGSFGQILLLDHADRLDEDGREAVRRIVRANERQARLIDGLLELSGLAHHPLRFEKVDLGELAREVLDEWRENDPGRQVETLIAEDLFARVDPALARIVMDNLIGNAWKFTARRDTAHIEVGREAGGAFYVRDDGAGFDQAYAHRLFSAFERLHDDTDFGGTGIGLATVHRIVERHGGRVWAEGVSGCGATFFFTLPPAR